MTTVTTKAHGMCFVAEPYKPSWDYIAEKVAESWNKKRGKR